MSACYDDARASCVIYLCPSWGLFPCLYPYVRSGALQALRVAGAAAD